VYKRLTLRYGLEFARHIAPAIIKPMHALWNEVIGFLFLSFGTIFGVRTVRGFMRGETSAAVLGSIGTFLMIWYGVSSFLKARKISRS
jgi:hypothetical protein